jgi:hypothetical protein
MQKGLEGSLTLEQVRKIIETSQRLSKDLRKLVG